MESKNNLEAAPEDRVLVITRVFNAPPRLVFKAWTDSDQLAKWHGPKGFTTTVEKNELRPGGAYRFHMRDPQGGDHWAQGVYREIVEPERLVMYGSWADKEGNLTRPQTVLTLTFEDLDGKTKLTLHQAVFESATACDEHRYGWTSSMEKLAEYVARL